jgi:hypothetical protein
MMPPITSEMTRGWWILPKMSDRVWVINKMMTMVKVRKEGESQKIEGAH